MNKIIYKIGMIAAGIAMMGLTACNQEPDEDSRYSKSDDMQTIKGYLDQLMQTDREKVSSFYYVLERSGYIRNLDGYGDYTCILPSNKGVEQYIDSLYFDPEKAESNPHNGIKEIDGFANASIETKLDALTDEICKEMAQYHLFNEKHLMKDVQSEGSSWNTMLGREVQVKVNTDEKSANYGMTTINNTGNILDSDIEKANGVIHVTDSCNKRNARSVVDQLRKMNGYSIFAEALRLTRFNDQALDEERGYDLYKFDDGQTYFIDKPTGSTGAASKNCWYPTTNKYGYTIFAESDAVFRAAGITDINSLIERCKEWYGNCSSWYPYLSHNGITVSTGTDYDNEFNVLHMFVAYHILNGAMSNDHLVYEKDIAINPSDQTNYWNYSFGAEPQDYFETFLPNTIMKIWEIAPLGKKYLYINRFRKNNTKTDEIGTMGSDATHEIVFDGVEIDRNTTEMAYNGYIHGIKNVLVYDKNAFDSFKERMRIDVATMFPEFMSNNIRFKVTGDPDDQKYGTGGKIRIPDGYCKYIHTYNKTTAIGWCMVGNWRALESNQLQFWGLNGPFDFAVRLPAVPDGQYEIRIAFPSMSNGCMLQFYIGNSYEKSSMVPIGLPFDTTLNPDEDTSFGYVPLDQTDDYGIESDQIMHTRGYMRSPVCFSRGQNNTITTKPTLDDPNDPYCAAKKYTGTTSGRSEGGYNAGLMLRRVIATVDFKQSEHKWLRFQSVGTGYGPTVAGSFDFIELVPLNVVNGSDGMSEDWY